MRSSVKQTSTAIEKVDTRFLESLIGYNARRAALAIIEEFLERMAQKGAIEFNDLIKPIDRPTVYNLLNQLQQNKN